MKKFSTIPGIIIVLFLVLTSCEKDKPISEALIGKWEVISMTQITYESNVKKAEIIIYLEAGEMSYQFIDGGSGIFVENDDDYLFSWTLTGNQLTLSELYNEDLMVNLEIDDDMLTWSYKEADSQVPNKNYEFIVSAKRIK